MSLFDFSDVDLEGVEDNQTVAAKHVIDTKEVFASRNAAFEIQQTGVHRLPDRITELTCYRGNVYYVRRLQSDEHVTMCLDQSGTTTTLFSAAVYFPSEQPNDTRFIVSGGFIIQIYKSGDEYHWVQISLDISALPVILKTTDPWPSIWQGCLLASKYVGGGVDVYYRRCIATLKTTTQRHGHLDTLLEKDRSCSGGGGILLPDDDLPTIITQSNTVDRMIFVRRNRLLFVSTQPYMILLSEGVYASASYLLFVFVDYTGHILASYKSALFPKTTIMLLDCSLNGSAISVVLSIDMLMFMFTFDLDLSV
jgi:hypothetical protein